MAFLSECLLALGFTLVVASCTRSEPQSRSGSGILAESSEATKKDGSPSPPERSGEAGTGEPSNAGRCVWPMLALRPAPASPAPNCPPDNLVRPAALPLVRVIFSQASGKPEIEAELAATPEEQTRGLMFRRELGKDRGMLFWGEEERVRRFWMHNTCIPLDLLFLALDGLIVGVLEELPTLNDESRSVPCASAHVLEVNGGWVRTHGVGPGQRVTIER